MKIRVDSLIQRKKQLLLSGSAASLSISPHRIVRESAEWEVRWEVIQSCYTQVVNGSRIFSTDQLRAAFGLSNDPLSYDEELIRMFGGDAAFPGKYIRWKNCLNIPCPGTGCDGDPNISILLDDEIKASVDTLINLPQTS